MPITAVEYLYEAPLADERAKLLAEHRAWLAALNESKVLVEAGAYLDGSGALLVFDFEDEDAARAELANDPFAKADLIASKTIKPWGVRWGAIAALGL